MVATKLTWSLLDVPAIKIASISQLEHDREVVVIIVIMISVVASLPASVRFLVLITLTVLLVIRG